MGLSRQDRSVLRLNCGEQLQPLAKYAGPCSRDTALVLPLVRSSYARLAEKLKQPLKMADQWSLTATVKQESAVEFIELVFEEQVQGQERIA